MIHKNLVLLILHILCSDNQIEKPQIIIARYIASNNNTTAQSQRRIVFLRILAMTLIIVGKIFFCNCKLMQSNKLLGLGGEFLFLLHQLTQSIDSTLLVYYIYSCSCIVIRACALFLSLPSSLLFS